GEAVDGDLLLWTDPEVNSDHSLMRCLGERAIGSCQPRRMAMNRNPKQRPAPAKAAPDDGRCSIVPVTTMAAPSRAAPGYSSVRNTVGISLTSTSRTMPPPIPVSTPSNIAPTGPASKASALLAPETAKSANPAASNTSTGLLNWLMIRYQ